MKKIALIITCIVLSFNVFAQKGVTFESLSFEQALKQAKKEKKMVFVFCGTGDGLGAYTSNEILSSPAVGEIVNDNFICVTINPNVEEKEDIEKMFKYKIENFPVTLLVRPNGSIQHIIPFVERPEMFIRFVKDGLHEETSWSNLNELYQNGKISKRELAKYYLIMRGVKKDSQDIYEKMNGMLTDEDRMQPDFWDLTAIRGYKSGEFSFLMENIAGFRKNIGKKVDEYVFNACRVIVNEYYGAFMCNLVRNSEEVIPDMQKLVENVSRLEHLKNEQHLMDRAIILECYARRDMDKIFEMVQNSLQGDANQEVLAMGIRLIEHRGGNDEYKRIVALGDTLLAKSPERSRPAIQAVLDRIASKIE